MTAAPIMLCDECKAAIEPEVTSGQKSAAVLQALSERPCHLGELAKLVHGRDTATNRRKISYLIRTNLRSKVEPVGHCGTWRLARSKQRRAA